MTDPRGSYDTPPRGGLHAGVDLRGNDSKNGGIYQMAKLRQRREWYLTAVSVSRGGNGLFYWQTLPGYVVIEIAGLLGSPVATGEPFTSFSAPAFTFNSPSAPGSPVIPCSATKTRPPPLLVIRVVLED